jgi:hypothetical protein
MNAGTVAIDYPNRRHSEERSDQESLLALGGLHE